MSWKYLWVWNTIAWCERAWESVGREESWWGRATTHAPSQGQGGATHFSTQGNGGAADASTQWQRVLKTGIDPWVRKTEGLFCLNVLYVSVDKENLIFQIRQDTTSVNTFLLIFLLFFFFTEWQIILPRFFLHSCQICWGFFLCTSCFHNNNRTIPKI